jgi:capsular exopolysaccharide synthesis family protein
MPYDAEVGIGEVGRTLWRRRIVVIGVALLVVSAALLFVTRQEPVYESSATVALLPDPDNIQTVPFYVGAVEELLPTYAELVGSRTFLDGVAGQLPFEATGRDLDVFAEPSSSAGVIRIVARSDDPVRARDVAAASAAAFVTVLQEGSVFAVQVIDAARVNEAPVNPSAKLVLAAALIVALVLGAGAGLAWERLFGRVQSSKDLSDATGLAVLGVIPEERGLRGRRVVIGSHDLGALEESLRALATNVVFSTATGAEQQGAITITGLNPEDGKSTVAANLAVVVAELGLDVLLIDADIHRPSQHLFFGLTNDVGLTSLVAVGARPDQVVRMTGYPGVRIVPSGPPLRNRAQELQLYLERMGDFRDMADLVLIDSPPLSATDDVRLLAAYTGRVLLLVRAGAHGPAAVRDAVASLAVLDTKVVGAALTRVRDLAQPGGSYQDYRRGDERPARRTGPGTTPPSAPVPSAPLLGEPGDRGRWPGQGRRAGRQPRP